LKRCFDYEAASRHCGLSGVNNQIEKGLEIKMQEMSVDDAKASGAIGIFTEKYGDKVKVYSIGGNSSVSSEPAFSREFCGGPHVANTFKIGKFKISKQEAVGAGVRRIRGVVD